MPDPIEVDRSRRRFRPDDAISFSQEQFGEIGSI
jgi:hypothetical protein